MIFDQLSRRFRVYPIEGGGGCSRTYEVTVASEQSPFVTENSAGWTFGRGRNWILLNVSEVWGSRGQKFHGLDLRARPQPDSVVAGRLKASLVSQSRKVFAIPPTVLSFPRVSLFLSSACATVRLEVPELRDPGNRHVAISFFFPLPCHIGLVFSLFSSIFPYGCHLGREVRNETWPILVLYNPYVRFPLTKS